MNCYLEGCTEEASRSERYFAYCSLEHKAKCVNVEINEAPGARLTIKEMQVRLKQMANDARHKKMMEAGG